LAASPIERVMACRDHPLQVGDHPRVDLIRAGAREIGSDLAVLRGERRNLARLQCADAGPLHAHRRDAERLPSLPLLLDESLRRHSDPAGRAGLRARREAAAALALLFGKDADEIPLWIGAAARNARLEAAHQVGGHSDLDVGIELAQTCEKAIQQTDYVFGQLW